MAHRSSKEQVYEYLEQITKEFDFEHLTRYTTLDICNKLNMSRSLVSLYLNELVKEDTVIKISSRPVYYLNRAGLERKFHMQLAQNEYLGIQELSGEIKSNIPEEKDFERAIGHEGSLNYCISQIKSALVYPGGLPILLKGEPGSGKTYLVKTLARLLDVPLAITDATSLTEAGYIGDDIESVVSKLLAAADNDVEKAEHGIIFIDEIDKIAKKKNTNQRDVSGEAVQQGLLKLLEGSEVEVPVGATSKNAMVPMVTVNTRNILFICGGAFEGLDSVIKKRTESSSLGFGGKVKSKEDDNNVMKRVVPHDLVKFGIVPELVGRLPVITVLDELDEDALCRILTEPKNSLIKQYTKLFKLDNIDFEITEDAKREIAKRTIEEKTGARGLRAIVEKILTKLMFEAPSDDEIVGIKITAECVRGEAEPEITRAVSSARKKK